MLASEMYTVSIGIALAKGVTVNTAIGDLSVHEQAVLLKVR